MRKSVFFCALAVLGALFVAPASAAPSAEVFGALPAIQTVRVSPSGRYFAIVQNLPGQTAVKTFDTATLKQIGGIAAAKQQVISGVSWHSDERLILFVVEVTKFAENIDTGDRTGTNVCRMMSIPREGTNPVQLLPAGIAKNYFLSCDLVGLHGPKPDTILVQTGTLSESGTSSRSPIKSNLRVHSINVLTGEAEVLDELGTRNTFDWRADEKGRLRLRSDAVAGQEVIFARLDGSNDWAEVHRQPLFAFESARESTGSTASVMQIAGFAPDPNQLYVQYWPGDRQAMGLFDLRTRQVTSVAADAKYDVDSWISFARKIVGAGVTRVSQEQVFFSPELRKLQSFLQSNYAGHLVTMVSASDDHNIFALHAEGPQWPGGAYLVLNVKANEATLVSGLYPGIDQASIGKQTYVTYTARDGMKIDAFLTTPPGSGKMRAAIVLPHGGPESRDVGGFDWLSQFLASRGYVVLQPQFRGSSGFGLAFSQAGRRQWGLKMQDDVSDGVAYLVANGIADPKRVCIMGWSYGGYAAMAGATLTPELYRCSIAGAGVSDLVEMLLYEKESGGWRSGPARYWRTHIGDMKTEKEKIAAASPARFANRVQGPMLLIHGELDNVVPIKQSEIMADALKAAGKPYEFVRLADENHNISFASTRIKTLKAMETFLLKHNPAN